VGLRSLWHLLVLFTVVLSSTFAQAQSIGEFDAPTVNLFMSQTALAIEGKIQEWQIQRTRDRVQIDQLLLSAQERMRENTAVRARERASLEQMFNTEANPARREQLKALMELSDKEDSQIRAQVSATTDTAARWQAQESELTANEQLILSQVRETERVLSSRLAGQQATVEEIRQAIEQFATTAKSLNLTSDVTFVTDKPGATVRYQTVGQRERNETPVTANNLTNSHESLYFGLYYVWTERAGRVTSDKNAMRRISQNAVTIGLSEQ